MGTAGTTVSLEEKHSFHSINVPSEWGLFAPEELTIKAVFAGSVSIQLMSPASGD